MGFDDFKFENVDFDFDSPVVDTLTVFGDFPYKENLHGKILTKGDWIFTIENPVSSEKTFDIIKDSVATFSERDGYIQKDYEIIDYVYFPERNQAEITITILENPIPLFVIWGAVAVAVLITGAIAVNSTLVEIRKVVTPITKSPLSYGILLVFLLPVLLVFGKQTKIIK